MTFNAALLKLPSELNKTVNIDSINSLTKLFATEDLQIIHSPSAVTASFSPETRRLTLPAWKGIPKVVYLLFSGHEIGHAIWTPTGGFNHPLIPKGMNTSGFRSILNVTEDARIEKRVKRKYPGLRADFTEGYKRLLNSGFFGRTLAQIAIDGNLADRLNVRFKIGSTLGAGIPFHDDEEVEFLERGYALEKFEDAVLLAVDIYEYLKEQGEDEDEDDGGADQGNGRMGEDPGDNEDSNEESDEEGSGSSSDGDEESDDDSDSDGTITDEDDSDSDSSDDSDSDSSDDSDSDSSDDSDDDSDSGSDDSDDDADDSTAGGDEAPKEKGDSENPDFDPRAETDEASRTNAEDLVDSSAQETQRFTIPFDRLDHDHFVHDTAKILGDFEKQVNRVHLSQRDNFVTTLRTECSKYVNNCKPVVAYLAKEFEMKKAADEYRRSSTARSGVLNVSKLHSYRYNEDIFLKKNILPDAKNHGLVMFIDLSGSMMTNMEGTLEQLINLVLFCKKVQIPFEVYGFGDYAPTRDDKGSKFKDHDITLANDFYLRKYISSDLKTSMFKKALEYIFFMKEYWANYGSRYNPTPNSGCVMNYHVSLLSEDQLGSTPLNDAIIAGMGIVKDFRAKSGVQICNVVFLTDGDSNPLSAYRDEDARHRAGSISSHRHDSNIVIYDEKSRKSFTVNPGHGRWYNESKRTTGFLLGAMANYCDVKNAGFFILPSGRNGKGELGRLFGADLEDASWATLKKDGVVVSHERDGYDAHFAILGGADLQTDEDGILDNVADDAKVATIRNAFKKGSKKKLKSRVLLTKFIEFIA
jgi:hypothetical protein